MKKVLFADLDGTIIETLTGAPFPKGIWDMKFKWDVLKKIKGGGFECLIIITNQGGIEK
jgi:histidinol phosphatase-like enzyme